jgi:hypothetical protein
VIASATFYSITFVIKTVDDAFHHNQTNTMKLLLCFSFLFLLLGCFKEKEGLHGSVSVSGKITDIVSGAPINNAVVELQGIKQRQGPLGYEPYETIVATDTTDQFGNYAFSYNADGEYQFELNAEPNSPLYVNSKYTIGLDDIIDKIGIHIKDLTCHRSAYARVNIRNVPPIDTPYFLALTAQDRIVLNNFYKDTTVYLKLVGRPSLPNDVRFNKNNQENQYPKITVGPWDTVQLQFNY